jgi:hypothetical protein
MDKIKNRIITVIVIILASSFLFSGCKGKEEKQTLTVSPLEQQAEGEAPSTATQTPVPTGETAPGYREGIKNTAPRITSLDVSPQNPVIGDTVKAEVSVFDREGDSVSIDYQWSKNEITLMNDSNVLSLMGDFKRGDEISLKVIPDDGNRKGNPLSIVITIANASPVIHPSQETFAFDGSFYSYQIRATDPDGDPLTYSLKSAPAGMTINPSTGLIQWNVPPDFKGKAPITVSVTDGYGGEAMQSFTLEITPEK